MTFERSHTFLNKPASCWWWCYPTPSEVWGRGGTPSRINSRATP